MLSNKRFYLIGGSVPVQSPIVQSPIVQPPVVNEQSPIINTSSIDTDAIVGLNEAEVNRLTKTSIYDSTKLNYMDPSQTVLYTIPKGTILYHGSMYKESFNPFDIRLGDDRLVSYFSPNKRLASDYIIGCALYPDRSGYIHQFRVKKDISKILILSQYEKKKDWTLSFIENTFCSRKFRIQLDGIGFFFPRHDTDLLANTILTDNENDTSKPADTFDSEFALCNPNEFLEYISTQRCISMRKISDNYNFNK